VFRSFRALKLIRKWESLNATLIFLYGAGVDIFYSFVLIILFIFLIGIIGMDLFANQVKINANDEIDLINGKSLRVNFDTIWNALLSGFSILIGDSWAGYYQGHARVSYTALIFFPLNFLILNFIMTNLFVAIILEKFFSDEEKEALEAEERRNKIFEARQKKLNEITGHERYRKRVKTLLTALKAYNAVLSLDARIKEKRRQNANELIGISLNIFDQSSEIRKIIASIINSTTFQVISYILTVVNNVALTFYTPQHDPESSIFITAKVFDILTTTFFCIEIIGKVISNGFIMNGPQSFLLSFSNVIDLISTLSGIILYSYGNREDGLTKILLLLETLRVFRMLSITEGFRRRVQAFIRGLYNILQTVGICALYILLFGCIAVHLYKGRSFHCSEENGEQTDNIETVYDCMNMGRIWEDMDIGYNNILKSFLTLFELFTGETWVNTLAQAQDSYEIDYEPIRDIYSHKILFFVFYMIFGYIFLRTLLIGVISNAFYFHNEELQGLRQLSSAQRRWVSLSKIIFKAAPIKTYKEDCRFYHLYEFLSHPSFKYFITTTIILNGVVICLDWYRAPYSVIKLIQVCLIIFNVIYWIEAILKLIFYGRDYFDSGWNCFDLAVVICITIMHIVTNQVGTKFDHTIFTLCWVAKLCTLFKKVKMLRNIFQIFVLALPSIITVAALLIVVMYIFAVMGIFLFSGVKIQENLGPSCHFQDILTAFTTIFRISTFDGWVDVMHDTSRGFAPNFYCINNPTYSDVVRNGGNPIGCGLPYAPVYFVIFILVIPFMFLNILIAIVVASVTEIKNLSESVLSDERLNVFLEVWGKYDPRGKGFILYSHIWDLLYEVPEPLGASEKEMNSKFYCAVTLWMLQLKIYRHEQTGKHFIAFYDVLEALVKKCIYKPQTLVKIYSNASKDALIKGLEELWDQKTQLAMDSENYMSKIEDIRYYYELKWKREAKFSYKEIKTRLPTLVLIILKMTRILKERVRANKNVAPVSSNLNNAKERNSGQPEKIILEEYNLKEEEEMHRKRHEELKLNDLEGVIEDFECIDNRSRAHKKFEDEDSKSSIQSSRSIISDYVPPSHSEKVLVLSKFDTTKKLNHNMPEEIIAAKPKKQYEGVQQNLENSQSEQIIKINNASVPNYTEDPMK